MPVTKVAYVARFAPWDTVVPAAAYTDDLDVAYRRSVARLATAGGLVLLFTVLAGWLVNRDIADSLGTLKAAMEHLAGGVMSVVIPGTDRRDEVGDMAGAVLVFKQPMETVAPPSRRHQLSGSVGRLPKTFCNWSPSCFGETGLTR